MYTMRFHTQLSTERLKINLLFRLIWQTRQIKMKRQKILGQPLESTTLVSSGADAKANFIRLTMTLLPVAWPRILKRQKRCRGYSTDWPTIWQVRFLLTMT